ncbi:hybrid sensor histidine kinase/response regulator [Nitrospina gracilis]|uniref:hybrid sensor histidine kinase/response regulator n=1 Tax=Nitrospina gracilis TaxID=35801 RepID=UPI001F23BD48|nr:hybrid sensor histidine kinase/response regulator [Nitrospina gracilis]MCF8721260.1 signal transduction histidine kinase [Nitrospina gracilis Nb-211]
MLSNQPDPDEFKILIVDDTPANVEVLQKTLEVEGYNISVALSGEKALTIASRFMPDLILLDIMMEGMDGYETCRRLKADPQTTDAPIIFISARNDIQDVVEGFNQGGVDYIVKPFKSDEVLVRVRTHLQIHSLKKQREALIQELEKKNRDLVSLNELKNKFLGIAAHDIRNPLSSIKGFIELLALSRDTFSPKEHDEMLQLISKSVNEVLGMVDDLLDISVIESGKLKLDLSLGDMASLLKERIQINYGHARGKGISIHEDIMEVGPTVFDRNRMAQVLDNLISNAIKYSPLESNVFIELRDENGGTRIRIRDEGEGIRLEDQQQIFAGFQKLGARPTGGEKSTGLGLAIVKSIVDSHRGRIEVQSEVGKGSTFEVALPELEMPDYKI